MKKFLMFAVLFVGFMIAMVAVSHKKQSKRHDLNVKLIDLMILYVKLHRL